MIKKFYNGKIPENISSSLNDFIRRFEDNDLNIDQIKDKTATLQLEDGWKVKVCAASTNRRKGDQYARFDLYFNGELTNYYNAVRVSKILPKKISDWQLRRRSAR